jgi:hypothetical protein
MEGTRIHFRVKTDVSEKGKISVLVPGIRILNTCSRYVDNLGRDQCCVSESAWFCIKLKGRIRIRIVRIKVLRIRDIISPVPCSHLSSASLTCTLCLRCTVFRLLFMRLPKYNFPILDLCDSPAFTGTRGRK